MPPGQVLTLFETKNVILHPLSDLAKGMQNGGQTDIIVMDFPKEFDKVSYQEMLGLRNQQCNLNLHGQKTFRQMGNNR